MYTWKILLTIQIKGKRQDKRKYPISSFAFGDQSRAEIFSALYNSIIDQWDLEVRLCNAVLTRMEESSNHTKHMIKNAMILIVVTLIVVYLLQSVFPVLFMFMIHGIHTESC